MGILVLRAATDCARGPRGLAMGWLVDTPFQSHSRTEHVERRLPTCNNESWDGEAHC